MRNPVLRTGAIASNLLSLAGGMPLAGVEMDAQYAAGDLDFLYSIDEIAHHMIILGYIHYARRPPSILDVGCGQGRLFELLKNFRFKSYLGIDVSRVAIGRTRSLARKKARFEVANFEEWQPSKRFNMIIFNESLYYAARPLEVLVRYSRWLTRGGSIIVSMWRCSQNMAIWQDIHREFKVANAHTVENRRGQIWDIELLRPRNALQRLSGHWVTLPLMRRFLKVLVHKGSR
ncbi:MAG: class I SAM-dependent methyltransferase [Chloroflexota bacterium]|nr:class I SAM-dependent methyltransferase [Chloroflexota bacterium]